MLQRTKVSNRIGAWRLYRRFTLEEIATRLGVTRSAVHSWEAGIAIPTATHLAMLCKVLRCSQRDLYPWS